MPFGYTTTLVGQWSDPDIKIQGRLGINDAGTHVFVAGHYTATGLSRVISIDVTYPASPTTASFAEAPVLSNSSSVGSTFLEGNYFYVCTRLVGRVYITDISDPENISVVGNWPSGTTRASDEVIKYGNYLYVVYDSSSGTGNEGLWILDVTDKTNPTLASTLHSANFNGASHPKAILATSGYLYVVHNSSDELFTYSLSDPLNPSLVDSLVFFNQNELHGPHCLAINGNYLYIGSMKYLTSESHDGHFFTVDISDKANPSIAYSISADTLVGADTSAIATLATDGKIIAITINGLSLLEVQTNIEKPKFESVNSVPNIIDIAIRDQYIYTSNSDGVVKIFKIENYMELLSASPEIISTVGYETVTLKGYGLTGATSVKFDGASAISYTVDSDTQITALAPPHKAGSVNVVVPAMSITQVGLIGSEAGGPAELIGGNFQQFLENDPDYMAMSVSGSSGSPDDGLAIVNVTDPSAPYYVNRTVHSDFTSNSPPVLLIPVGNFMYTLQTKNGSIQPSPWIAKWDVSDPTAAPVYLGKIWELGVNTSLYASDYDDTYIYMAVDGSSSGTGSESLYIMNYRTLTTLGFISHTYFNYPSGLKVSGNRVLITANTARRLTSINVEDRNAPFVEGSYYIGLDNPPTSLAWDGEDIAAVHINNYTANKYKTAVQFFNVSNGSAIELLSTVGSTNNSTNSPSTRYSQSYLKNGVWVIIIVGSSTDSLSERSYAPDGSNATIGSIGGYSNLTHIVNRGNYFYIAKNPGLLIAHASSMEMQITYQNPKWTVGRGGTV